MRIGVLTTGRQDWGILRSTCGLLRDHPSMKLCLLAGGMHCSARFGKTERDLAEEGFAPEERLAWIPDEEVPSAAAQSSRVVTLVTEALERRTPDALLLAADRFETHQAAFASVLAGVPVVHLHGGEETEGAFDNLLRHAITKMSHLHFVSRPDHARRVLQMGEDPAAVHVVGAPGLDNLHRPDLPDRAELERTLGLSLAPPVVVVTLHPATLGDDPRVEARAVCEAMDRVPATYVITLPNTDPGHAPLRDTLEDAARKPGRKAVPALGERRYWGLLRASDAMLGNSSSGLIEAPLLGLPAVNVGARQKGRVRGPNVLDVAPESDAVAAALRKALDPGFRASLRSCPSPYGDGRSAERIVRILESWRPPRPPVKKWFGE